MDYDSLTSQGYKFIYFIVDKEKAVSVSDKYAVNDGTTATTQDETIKDNVSNTIAPVAKKSIAQMPLLTIFGIVIFVI